MDKRLGPSASPPAPPGKPFSAGTKGLNLSFSSSEGLPWGSRGHAPNRKTKSRTASSSFPAKSEEAKNQTTPKQEQHRKRTHSPIDERNDSRQHSALTTASLFTTWEISVSTIHFHLRVWVGDGWGARGEVDLSARDPRTRIRADSPLRRPFTPPKRLFTSFSLLFNLFGLKYLTRGTMKCLNYGFLLDH